MLKENSLNMENSLSTTFENTLQSYSSKYRALKQMRTTKNIYKNTLPIKL